jgi:hypothetical protein
MGAEIKLPHCCIRCNADISDRRRSVRYCSECKRLRNNEMSAAAHAKRRVANGSKRRTPKPLKPRKPQEPRQCADCGADISELHARRERCDRCRKQKRLDWLKVYRTARWNSDPDYRDRLRAANRANHHLRKARRNQFTKEG